VTLPGIVAVDVGGTKIRAGSVIDGRLGQVRTVPTPASAGAQAILDAIAEVASAVIAGAQTIRDAETTRDTETSTDHSAAAVTGRVTEGGTGLVTETGAGRDGAVSDWRIGVGAAGVIDPVAGTVVSATESLTGWAGTRLVDELEARTRLRVRAVNDVHAHALGEAAAGASHGTDSSLLVAAGTGIGGGIIWDGRLLTGRNSAAGHIGHLPSPAAADLPCPCGGTGHVEAIASGPAILDTYRRLLAREGPSRQDEEGPGPHGAAAAPEPTTPASASQAPAAAAPGPAPTPGMASTPGPAPTPGMASTLGPATTPGVATTRELAVLASAGDRQAAYAFEVGARALGSALGGIANALSPEVIVIGGGLAEAGELWWAPLRESFASELIPATAGTPLRKAELGQDAALIGAAGLWDDEEKESH